MHGRLNQHHSVKLHNAVIFQMLHSVGRFDEKLQNLSTLVIYRVIGGTNISLTRYENLDFQQKKKTFCTYNFQTLYFVVGLHRGLYKVIYLFFGDLHLQIIERISLKTSKENSFSQSDIFFQ